MRVFLSANLKSVCPHVDCLSDAVYINHEDAVTDDVNTISVCRDGHVEWIAPNDDVVDLMSLNTHN